jgi:hypothetical protein
MTAGACSGRAALIYWNADIAVSISGSDIAGIASEVFNDPAANQSTTTPLISGSRSSSGYAGASGGNNYEADAKVGSLSTSSSTYFSITLVPISGYTITLDSISMGSRSTATGPTALTFYSSIDNYAAAIGSASVSASSGWAFISTINFSGNSLTDSDGSPLTFRIYGSGGSGTQPNSANWRIDDIIFTVTSSLVPVPESAT